jgi:hypothetical protein
VHEYVFNLLIDRLECLDVSVTWIFLVDIETLARIHSQAGLGTHTLVLVFALQEFQPLDQKRAAVTEGEWRKVSASDL